MQCCVGESFVDVRDEIAFMLGSHRELRVHVEVDLYSSGSINFYQLLL